MEKKETKPKTKFQFEFKPGIGYIEKKEQKKQDKKKPVKVVP
jgi:hypothetical protein